MKKYVPTFEKFLDENLKFEKVYDHIKKHFNGAQNHDDLKKLKKEADELDDKDTEGWDTAAIKYFYELRKTMLGDELDGKTAMDMNKEDGKIMQSHPHTKQYRKTW